MELIETESEKPAAPAERERIYDPRPARQPEAPAPKRDHGQTWLRVLAAILIGIILVILIVLLARWIYHSTHHNNSSPASSRQSAGKSSSSSSKQPGASPAPSRPSGGSNSTASPPPASPNPSQPIANTGPGNVVGLFIGASLAAAGLHYIASLRKQARANPK